MHQLLVLTLVLVAFCSLGSTNASAYDKIVTHSRIRARKEGPNVCALQQVQGTKKKYFSTCRNWYKGTICGKKAMVVYECCPGYMKLEGMRGCPAVAPIDHVYGTLGLIKAATTQKYADVSKLREEIEGKGSFTMFAPSNDAWDELDRAARAALESNVNIELYNALHYHMINRRVLTKDMKNGMTVPSMYNELGLHFNHYPNGIVTVNCARIIHGNQLATNGVVHVIDRVISAVGNTIKDYLESNEELSTFSTMVASDMMDKLGEPGQYTLFAPTNEAIDKLNPDYMERIMEDNKVIAALVNYHLINSVQCAEAFMSGSVYETAEGSTIEIGCDGDSLTVNGIKMVLKKDIVASNGVIHLIDQVLIPDSAKEVMELMGQSQSTFSSMVFKLGLAESLGPKTEYTLLVPVNGAFTMSDEVMTTDQSRLRLLLENHILKLKVKLSELYNEQKLETLAGKLLRVFIYRTAVCIENACMVRGSKEGSNGVLHSVKSLIKLPEKTTYELLIADGRFKIFLSLMETAGLNDLLKQEGSYTIFAPTDDAFEGLSKEDFALLKSDLTALRNILLYHFSNGIFINGGLEGGVTNLLKTFQGKNLQVKSVNNSIHVNSVDVPNSDLMATNGVIHVVKNVLYPGDLPVGRQDLLVLLQKLIKYIQIKFVSGFSYTEIPLTFIKRTITTTHYVEGPESKVTRVIEAEPSITKVIRVIEGDPSLTKVTRVIEGDPSLTKVTRVIEGDASLTKVTRVIEGDPSLTKVTRVIEGDPSLTKVTRVIEGAPSLTRVTKVIEGDPSLTKVTRVIEGDASLTKVTRVIEGDPSLTKVTRVIEGDPSLTKVTRVIEGDPSLTKVTRVIEGDPSLTKVTRVIEGDPSLTKVTRFIEGDPSLTKVTRFIEGDPSLTKVTRVIEGDPSLTKVTRVIEGDPSLTKVTRFIEGDPSLTKVTRVIEGDPSLTKVTRVIEGDPSLTKVTRVIEGDPSLTKVTRVIEGDPSRPKVSKVIEGQPPRTKVTRVIEGQPPRTKVTRVIEGQPPHTKVSRVIEGQPPRTKVTRVIEGQPSITKVTRVIDGTDVDADGNVIRGPDFSRITTIHGNPSMIDEESERITKIIQGGGRFAAARKLPVGMRRRTRLVRRHHKPRE
ncbi:periostin isoform X2 [Archocentrus centrarchus]|uniref:periostin isoform X2 n=1 Tax=Archocentrus centrarchus TaxID=63155 RepID=UPI0011EA2F4D|nr:periostin isoform X2 [Archocentrus centrarchus]